MKELAGQQTWEKYPRMSRKGKKVKSKGGCGGEEKERKTEADGQCKC